MAFRKSLKIGKKTKLNLSSKSGLGVSRTLGPLSVNTKSKNLVSIKRRRKGLLAKIFGL